MIANEKYLSGPRDEPPHWISRVATVMSFLSDYRKGFDWLASMRSFDACMLFATYNSLITQRGISGPTLKLLSTMERRQ